MNKANSKGNMKIIVVASGKGGTCKTNLVTCLGVRAANKQSRVAMIDLNKDQASLSQWWALRGRGVNPYLLADNGALREDIEILRADGFRWCFIDTPPTDMDIIEFAILVADVVLVPIRPAFVDISAIDAIVDMCKRRHKAYAFVLSAFDQRKIFNAVNREALAMLDGRGRLLKARIPYSPGFVSGQSDGKTGPEIDKKLQAPINDVWSEVSALPGADVKTTRTERRANV